jgi:hypothetical protein
MITFIETAVFARAREQYLDDFEFAELQQFLIRHPDAGNVVPGSGGVRKLRWAASGRGKRGGSRILYVWANARGEIWLLVMYGKNVQENIAPETLRRLKEAFHGNDD